MNPVDGDPAPRRAAPPDRRPAGHVVEMRRRGTTTIADAVFEKVAGQAASEVTRASGRSGGVLGIGSSVDADARPKISVDLSADSVDLDVAVGIAYPGSIRAAAQQVRDRIRTTVEQITGVPVHRVDIDVTFLTTATDSRGSGPKQVLR